jgi:hypothetical protein
MAGFLEIFSAPVFVFPGRCKQYFFINALKFRHPFSTKKAENEN